MVTYSMLLCLFGETEARRLIKPYLPKPNSRLWYCESHDETYEIDWVGLEYEGDAIFVDSGLYRLTVEGYDNCTSDQRIKWANRNLKEQDLLEQNAPKHWFRRHRYLVTKTCKPYSTYRYGQIDPMQVLEYIGAGYQLTVKAKGDLTCTQN